MNILNSWNSYSLNTTPKQKNTQAHQFSLLKSQQFGSSNSDYEKSENKNKKSRFGKSVDDNDELIKEFRKTSDQLMDTNFNHHNPVNCVCESCNCGRHLCKLHNVKPNLTKTSNYKQSYPKKSPIPNIINRSSEYQKLQGPHIGMDSNYNKDFINRKGDSNERPKPEDLLKGGGPSLNLTSYGINFPGFRGGNQYVKHTDQHFRADYPMRAKSTYTNSFVNKSLAKPITEKIQDNLKPSSLWTGKTTYGKFFGQPNPESYPDKVKNIEKLEINPRFGRQYETTYKNSFIPQQNPMCPAKQKLQTKMKGIMNSSKDRFNENSDFKSFNPTFQSISTSKHFYV